MKILISHVLMALFITVSISCSNSDSESAISTGDAWIREAPPNARALAGYLKIRNHQDTPVTLVSVNSPMFSSVELHRSVFNDGVASMIRKKQITIPADSQIELKPGDYHMMMFNPTGTLKDGDEVQATLEFADGETLDVTLDVRRAIE